MYNKKIIKLKLIMKRKIYQSDANNNCENWSGDSSSTRNHGQKRVIERREKDVGIRAKKRETSWYNYKVWEILMAVEFYSHSLQLLIQVDGDGEDWSGEICNLSVHTFCTVATHNLCLFFLLHFTFVLAPLYQFFFVFFLLETKK